MAREDLGNLIADYIVDTAEEFASAIDWRIENDALDYAEHRLNQHGWFKDRTCKNLATRDDGFNCSECNCEVVGCMVDDFGSFDNPLLFSYCPNCRAKVVE